MATNTPGLTLPMASPSPGPPQSPNPGTTNRGFCTLSLQGRTFQFRTNPNAIWWSYELIKNVQETYGGRVIQLLGTRLGDLQIKVECGQGGWPYLMSVVTWLRELLSDQRKGTGAADFEYTTRNWHLKVYALTVPFQDEVEATARELTLNFKIQEDISGALSQVSLNAELSRLQDGVYGPGSQPHNQYNDQDYAQYPAQTAVGPSGTGYNPSGIINTVDSAAMGTWSVGGIPTGLGLLGGIPGLGSLGSLGGLGGAAGLGCIGLGSIPGLG